MLANEKLGQLHSIVAGDGASLVYRFFQAPSVTLRAIIIHLHGIHSHDAGRIATASEPAWHGFMTLSQSEHVKVATEQSAPTDDLADLHQANADFPEMIIVDASLRTVEVAAVLAEERADDAFNTCVSKCGGLINSMRIGCVADQTGLAHIAGAQAGEIAILPATSTLPASWVRWPTLALRGFDRGECPPRTSTTVPAI